MTVFPCDLTLTLALLTCCLEMFAVYANNINK